MFPGEEGNDAGRHRWERAQDSRSGTMPIRIRDFFAVVPFLVLCRTEDSSWRRGGKLRERGGGASSFSNPLQQLAAKNAAKDETSVLARELLGAQSGAGRAIAGNRRQSPWLAYISFLSRASSAACNSFAKSRIRGGTLSRPISRARRAIEFSVFRCFENSFTTLSSIVWLQV